MKTSTLARAARPAFRTVSIAWLASCALAFAQQPAGQQPAAPAERPAAAEKQDEPRVGLRFEGFLPGTHDEKLEGVFDVEFRIYLSPQGGEPVWRESREVRVVKGRMDVELGEKTPIPFAIHLATFKFLGASVGGAPEVYPRFAVVNTVYASPEEALRKPAARAPERYAEPRVAIGAKTEAACSWERALRAARDAGGDLPDYRDWYADLARSEGAQALERSGHYEWVLPWVYDTASHGEYNRLFRGRFQGCDYMDLSPQNEYAYRIARAAPAPQQESRER